MNRLAYIGIAIAAFVIFVAIFAPWIATHRRRRHRIWRCAFSRLRQITGSELTDSGRDVFSRVVYGARISLEVGISVVSVSSIFGIVIGAIAGFYGGLVDKFLSGYVFNVFLAFPGLLLAIALVAFLGAGLGKLILALCVIGWVGYARVMRAQVLKIREYDYVQAARAIGAGNMRILFVAYYAKCDPAAHRAGFARAGRCGAVRSFVILPWLGIPPPAPSWGTMIDEARQYFATYPHVLFFPGVAIALTVLAFNFIGDGLRAYLDPKQRSR